MKSTFSLQFFDQFESSSSFAALENIKTIYHYSIPNTKLFYPEPFIASPSFMHSDLWFVHILLYQYWLWFVFIFLIVFFFTMFLVTIRWCNMRVRPRRETRGVSRSKCGDLITATVPVTWAASIIVNESTDAIDYYDGFGTTELVIGIRAYQWGWEYYYPKDVDLNYNLKPNYSMFIGNSIKYEQPNDRFLLTNNLWKFYQNKITDAPILPLFFILTTFDSNRLFNFANINEIGLNPILESNAFKKIKLFSKSCTNDLIHRPASFFLLYKNLSSLYTLKLNYLSSYSYGSKKQHNFLTNYALINNQKTYFNANSIKTLFTFNYPINETNSASAFAKTLIMSNEHSASPYKKFNEYLLLNLYYDKKWQFLNLNSDKKQIFPISLKIFNKRFSHESFFVKIENLLKTNLASENFLFKNSNSKFNFLINSYVETSPFQKNSFNLFSANQSVGTTEKTVATFFKFSPNTILLNHAPTATAMNSLTANHLLQKNVLTTFSNFYTTFANNLQNPSFIKTGSQRLAFDTPYSPIVSTNATLSPLNYDTNRIGETPLILQGKEELIPTSALSAYWNFYFTTSNPLLKFSQLRSLNSRSVELYLPFFTFYYDYDFRNIQTSELIEDSLWETAYPFFLQFEYIDLRTNFNVSEKLIKLEKVYNSQNRNSTTLMVDSSRNDITEYSSLFFVDDAFANFKVLATKNFFLSPLLYLINLTEDSYDMAKMLLFLNNAQSGVQLFSQFSFLTTHYYTTVLDAFKSNFEEFNFFEPMSENFKKNNKTVRLFDNSEWGYSINAHDNNTERSAFLHLNSETSYPIAESTFRFSNNLNLRGTAKNSITTYNALQKVFKTRFDENRSHAKLFDLANSYENVPFLTETKLPYENMLGKNKHSFLHLSWYKTLTKTIFNSNFNLETTLNFYFYEFPFLLALKSDSSRYIWFDWFSKWGYYEVQPSSSSRYAVFGLPYFNKNFDFATSSNEGLNETENYLTRIAHSRKNYIPSWSYSPYFFLKNNVWFNQNIFFFINSLQLANSLTETMLFLQYMDWYWINYCGYLNHLTIFAPTNSNTTTYNRTAPINNVSSQGYYYLISTLADSLTKREFLYRELFFTTNKISDLSKIFANSPKNALFWEIKAILGLFDFHEVNSEYSRNSFYSALIAFKDNYIFSLFPMSISSRFDRLALSCLHVASSSQSEYSVELLKNQYKPMKKGIINMIRLHATGAMALPIEIRLQVLASSKDVIHSWAIPSAGIKIDCVPGYSSHRVMIFLVAGIYWGQCMEICGRYHHWMPIVVYFMKRDLFFLWCTHFIHLNNNSIWSTNEKQYNDLYKPVSFDKSLWLKELTN